MAVINVLYLPRDDRLRPLVRLALDFVEEVYRDEILSDLKFIVFDPEDELDREQVKHIVVKHIMPTAIFVHEVMHIGCRYEPLSLFYWPHYVHSGKYAWIPVSRSWEVKFLFYVVVHEVTHHVLYKLPKGHAMILAHALRSDLGVDVDEVLSRYRVPIELAEEVSGILSEATALYIVDNYFMRLEKEPRTPTHLTDIRKFGEGRYSNIIRASPRPKPFAKTLAKIYYKLARQDLASFRRAVHEAFARAIKRFPVDVVESNPSRYRILYSNQPITELPL
jgi:hypothetical protein